MNISSIIIKYSLCNHDLMNKILMPALLVATIMVAGMFAFAPVEQASTVHTTGITQGTTTVSSSTTGAEGTVTLTCGATSACVIQEIFITDEDAQAQVLTDVDLSINGDTIALTSCVTDALGADVTVALLLSDFAGLQGTSGDTIPVSAGEVLTLTITGASDNFTVEVISSGTITIGFA